MPFHLKSYYVELGLMYDCVKLMLIVELHIIGDLEYLYGPSMLLWPFWAVECVFHNDFDVDDKVLWC